MHVTIMCNLDIRQCLAWLKYPTRLRYQKMSVMIEISWDWDIRQCLWWQRCQTMNLWWLRYQTMSVMAEISNVCGDRNIRQGWDIRQCLVTEISDNVCKPEISDNVCGDWDIRQCMLWLRYQTIPVVAGISDNVFSG